MKSRVNGECEPRQHSHDYVDQIRRWQEREQSMRERHLGSHVNREQFHDRGVLRMVRQLKRNLREEKSKIVCIQGERDIRAEVSKRFAKHETRGQIAEDLGLKVVDGKIRIPDVRVLVEKRWGEHLWIALEYATETYRRGRVQQKRAAGFHVATGLRAGRRPKDGPDILGEIAKG